MCFSQDVCLSLAITVSSFRGCWTAVTASWVSCHCWQALQQHQQRSPQQSYLQQGNMLALLLHWSVWKYVRWGRLVECGAAAAGFCSTACTLVHCLSRHESTNSTMCKVQVLTAGQVDKSSWHSSAFICNSCDVNSTYAVACRFIINFQHDPTSFVGDNEHNPRCLTNRVCRITLDSSCCGVAPVSVLAGCQPLVILALHANKFWLERINSGAGRAAPLV